jgi:pyrophosphatase PpaX
LQQHDALIREIAGVREAVARVAASGQIKMGIVTSKKTSTAHLGLKACKLADFFPVVVGLDCTDKHKPRPEPALRALELLGETPGDHVVMVGDSPLDILCGRNAGCRTVAVGWTELERSHVDAAEPHAWAETPADLLTLLLGSGAAAPPTESTPSAVPGAGGSPAPVPVRVVA